LFSAEINLSPQATWDQNGCTIVGWRDGSDGPSLTQLSQPFGISITRNDVLYISDSNNHRIVVVQLGSMSGTFTIGSGSNQFQSPLDVFVTNTSLYVIDSGNKRVQKMALDGSNPTTVLSLNELKEPHYLYVDHNANIYVSVKSNHRVLLFRSNSADSTIVAGTGVVGSNNDQLFGPYGVFVSHTGTIYIADCENNRIMKWLSGATTGICVAGDGTGGISSTQLHHPTQVIADANEYMYISERDSARITR
jgi:sugar lactone lactonase YvrE